MCLLAGSILILIRVHSLSLLISLAFSLAFATNSKFDASLLLHVKRIETNECGLAAASYCYELNKYTKTASFISLHRKLGIRI